jgi:tetratricopeptide (TPR) repeat protein
MPKQRRATSPQPAARKKPATRAVKKAKPQTAGKSTRARRPAAPSKRKTTPVGRKTARPQAASHSAARPVAAPRKPAHVAGTASHELAVAAYERGFRALQQRQFDRAAQALTSVLNGFPDEKEMQERARVYLSICERQLGGAKPRSFEERVNAATVAINRGAFGDAVRLLRELETDKPDSDHVQYLLSVTFTAMGDIDKALTHLRRAVELNPENRLLSSADTDLEPLRQHTGFAAALATSSPSRRPGPRKR